MANGATTGAISGGAQGAAYGFMLGGPVGGLVGGGLGLLGGYLSGSSADRQFQNQIAWANYNNIMQYNTTAYNVQSSMDLAAFQAGLTMAAAGAEAAAARAAAAYNAELIGMTLLYDTQLLTEELYRIWEMEDLDLTQLELYRDREEASIITDQSVSGTIIGEGSNADVVISQQTQRELDKTIIMHNADIAAADIANSMAQGVWQGEVAIQQTIWEGEMSAYMSETRGAASAASMLGTAILQGQAAMWSAESALQSGQYGIAQSKWTQKQQNFQNMIGGLFQAGSTFAMGHYASKSPVGSGGNSTAWQRITKPSGPHPSQRHMLPQPYAPGTSLITGP